MIIKGVRKNEVGTITSVKLDDGSVLTIDEAIIATQQGKIDGVSVGKRVDGTVYLHSKRGIPDYKLSELPEF